MASKINNEYQLGYRVVIEIDKDEYNEIKLRVRERSHHNTHKYLIISLDSGFSNDELSKYEKRISSSLNKNKVEINGKK